LWLAAIALLFAAASAQATTISYNTGSLGAAANGTNADSVTTGPGAVAAGDDLSAVYPHVFGGNTVVPYQPALNPASTSPFTIEFWGRPLTSDNDDAPLSNRVAAGNRSGWVFFQRAPSQGWNLRMYSGAGSGLGWDLTGGTSNLDEWSHVVATWDGAAAQLFVNGALVDDSNDGGASGVYNANPAATAANLIVANSDTSSPYNGSVDEIAYYATVLTPAQIQAHFDAVSSPTAGLYQSLVRSDGALLQLSNNAVPEPSAMMLLGAGAMLLLRRRASETRD
jgi:hypothetical protein